MTIDATVAGEDANSYLTVADANALAGDDLGRFAAAWLAAPFVDQEKALIRATRQISQRYGPTVIFDADQALRFPRSIDYTTAGVTDTPFLPADLVRATYEQAIYVLVNAPVLDDAASRRARGVFSSSSDDASYSLAVDPEMGRIAPEALAALEALRATNPSVGPTLRSFPMTSSYPP